MSRCYSSPKHISMRHWLTLLLVVNLGYACSQDASSDNDLSASGEISTSNEGYGSSNESNLADSDDEAAYIGDDTQDAGTDYANYDASAAAGTEAGTAAPEVSQSRENTAEPNDTAQPNPDMIDSDDQNEIEKPTKESSEEEPEEDDLETGVEPAGVPA